MKTSDKKQPYLGGRPFTNLLFVFFILVAFGIATIPQLTVGDFAALYDTKSYFLLFLFLLLSVLFPTVFIMLNGKNLKSLRNEIVFSWINFMIALSFFLSLMNRPTRVTSILGGSL